MKREFTKPLLITFEGGEACGKSTQSKIFYDWYKFNYDPEAIHTREPGGVSLSEKIRGLLLETKGVSISPLSELLLFQASRSQFFNEFVLPTLKEGKSIICDRGVDSTTAYQGYGRGQDVAMIESLNLISTQNRFPDLTFIIDIQYSHGLKIRRAQEGTVNRLDLEDEEFHKTVNEGYRHLALSNKERIVILDYEVGIEKVQAKLREEFMKKYSL